MERRPELLSSVMLRQNPHNVHEWHKRVHLFPDKPTRQILVYTEAVKTVDSDKARRQQPSASSMQHIVSYTAYRSCRWYHSFSQRCRSAVEKGFG